MPKTFYLTTPIFYPNARLHLGHAYTTTLADILARYHRALCERVYFLTGSDENTEKMVVAAEKEGKEPMVFLDEIVKNFGELYAALGISYDEFIRTTDQKRHWPGAQVLWGRIAAAGDLYKKEYEGLYCVGHEAFLTEKDLVDGKCPDHGSEPEFLKEENWFFRLSKYTDALCEKIETGELAIIPETRKHEILSFLSQGLEDVSFSRLRKSDWPEGLGVPVPGDDSQIMYVWCDALSNYITALGFGQPDGENYRTFWPADVHIIGKDILRFHAAIWPAMLLSAELPLPKALLVHGFITSGGRKMSKTLGNVIDPFELIDEYGAEALRYYFARHVSPFEDGDLTREHFKDVYNGELANGLGNLVARVMRLSELYVERGVSPHKEALPREYTEAFRRFEINRAADYLWSRIGKLDEKITATEPFKLIKEDIEAGKKLIAELAEEVYQIGWLLGPFLPSVSEQIMRAVVENKKPATLFPRKE